MGQGAIGVGFVGLGVYLPERRRTNDFWDETWRSQHASLLAQDIGGAVDKVVQERLADVDREVAEAAPKYHHDLFRGSVERRVMDEEQVPSDMEAAACIRALEHAGVSADEVDCLIVYSTVSDRISPRNQGVLSHRLGLRKDIIAFDMEAGCATFLPATTLASRLIQTGEIRTALIVVSSAASWILDYSTPSSPLAGDGAVAAVVQAIEPGFGFIAQHTLWRGEQHDAILMVPKGCPDIRWTRSDQYTERIVAQQVDRAALHIAGAHAASLARESCHAVLERAGYTVDDVDFLVMAHSTAWFPEALSKAIGVPADRVLTTDLHFQKYGHLFCGSAPLNLYLSHFHGRLGRGDLVLVYSPGVGFTQSAMLYRWNLDRPVPELR